MAATPTTIPRQAILPPIDDPSVHLQIDRLAGKYLDAGGLVMDLLVSIGGGAQGLLDRLPGFVRHRLDGITLAALNRAFDAASRSRHYVRDRGDWFNRLATTVSGAAGGVAGLPGAMVELPLTISMLLRAILEIAAEHGFDPEAEETRIEAIRVFAAAGPMSDDDGTDMGLLAAKMTITGQTVQGLIARIAPRLAAVLGQKLAAQATPVFGAVAGASINFAFAGYYQEVARVHFGLLRLARETGIPREALTEALLDRMDQRRGKALHKPARG